MAGFIRRAFLLGICLLVAGLGAPRPAAAEDLRRELGRTIESLAAHPERRTGSQAAAEVVADIEATFTELGLAEVGRQQFLVPLRDHAPAGLTLPGGARLALNAFKANAISPQAVPPEGLAGPAAYVADGSLSEMDGLPVAGSIVFMDLVSGKNWLNAAMLGAAALVFVDWEESPKGFFEEKLELSPLDLPVFHCSGQALAEVFPDARRGRPRELAESVRLEGSAEWRRITGENVYGLIPGTDKALAEQLVIFEAPFDASGYVSGRAPGADQGASLATLLALARHLKDHPPARSVLLLATSGHDQGLAGMREFAWTARSKGTRLKEMERQETRRMKRAKGVIEALAGGNLPEALAGGFGPAVREALDEAVKNEVDRQSSELMRLRLAGRAEDEARIKDLSARRLALRRLSFDATYTRLAPEDQALLAELLAGLTERQAAILTDAGEQAAVIDSGQSVRRLIAQHEVAAVVSLHLSSHGDGLGAFDYGFFYDIREDRDRNPFYGQVGGIMNRAGERLAADPELAGLWQDTLRPSRLRSWQSWFLDRPALGGEVSALAGYLGFTLATLNDARALWGTPYDTPDAVDLGFLARQAGLVLGLAEALSTDPEPLFDGLPRQGLSELEGQTSFIRQGELFADQPAPGTVLQAYQGPGMAFAMADTEGRFRLVGICDKKNTFHKVILEGYRFDPGTGRVLWAIDKKQTGKDAYRVKMNHMYEETNLVMFAARQITVFNLLEPRTFHYMPRINVLDGRREALPVHYWYSRIDTRSSSLADFYLEPGTPLKLTLSDSVLNRKLVLTNGTPESSVGGGYLPEDWPIIPATEFHVAKDMWTLLAPRIENLETHGIVNERVRALQAEGLKDLAAAKSALSERRYDTFLESARSSWALATRVYNDVEGTQKDVLLGVLFYVALFIPFAWCLERVIFAFADIHRRILAFLGLLGAVIGVVYLVHPAFQLTYSPLVVILAFFIVGLSAMVGLIIFLRFEQEMQAMQKTFAQAKAGDISRWRAFVAAFVIGVSNLRRRKVRTALTCLTLVILTFTIMSFTSVKSVRQSHATRFSETAPYQGLLLKTLTWRDLPPETLAVVQNAYQESGLVVPRVWLEDASRTSAVPLSVRAGQTQVPAQGMIGLSAHEPQVLDLGKTLTGGRWFGPEEQDGLIISARLAAALGIDPARPDGAQVQVFGMDMRVVGCFDGSAFMRTVDLDGEPLTPVVFPSEAVMARSEAEIEAMEGGEDVDGLQSRYEHVSADQILIAQAATVMALGGRLKDLAVRPHDPALVPAMAQEAADRFGLTLFAGLPGGTFLTHAADVFNYSGLPNIVIPLVIAVLIVLNTMIASVYERRREIAVYTSVGMAPTHVSYLFIAEAVAFAVISVVLGYLLAQIAADFLSGTPLWSGMTANYSSMSGVAAMILVIAVTLASVIYPSRVAADIAIPDVNRSWTMPESDGHELVVSLPFLLKRPERDCVGGFLLNYYQAHQDVTQGLFCSDDIGCSLACPTTAPGTEPAEACLTLSARIWLAPFDFGVKQRTALIFCPSASAPGFLEIQVRLTREAGEAGVWRRINKGFLNDLRKQLLIWRSLTAPEQRTFETLIERELARRSERIAATSDSPQARQ